MIITTCLILRIPAVAAVGAAVEALVDGLVREGPLDEQPTEATATTTATIPRGQYAGERIRRTLRAPTRAADAATSALRVLASCEPKAKRGALGVAVIDPLNHRPEQCRGARLRQV